jgi:UDP-N-acetylglucosamine enolpyruvyl transferase
MTRVFASDDASRHLLATKGAPEAVADLCHLLVAMGADIEGIGSATLVVHGVEPGSLRAADHRVVTDRIQVATYLAAVGVAGGELTVRVRARDGRAQGRKWRERDALVARRVQ